MEQAKDGSDRAERLCRPECPNMKVRCNYCGHVYEPESELPKCPKCSSHGWEPEEVPAERRKRFSQLTPEEKLVCALFGELAWLEGQAIRHFLSDEGRKVVRNLLDEVMAKSAWHKRAVRILRLRFGFEPRTEAEKTGRFSSDARTLQETSVYFNVSRERIRQIEAKMLRKLRHPLYSTRLRPYITNIE